jgi:threonyl-tRNA synthetase
MSPVQVAVIPVGEFANEKAQEVFEKIKEAGFRVELYDENEGFGKRIRKAKKEKLPYFIIIGEKDIEAGKVTLENRDTGESQQLSLEEVLEIFEKDNKK